MKEFINAATATTGGASFTSAATGQLYLAAATFAFFLAFGLWGGYWKYKDSKAIRRALETGDLRSALDIHAGGKHGGKK